MEDFAHKLGGGGYHNLWLSFRNCDGKSGSDFRFPSEVLR